MTKNLGPNLKLLLETLTTNSVPIEDSYNENCRRFKYIALHVSHIAREMLKALIILEDDLHNTNLTQEELESFNALADNLLEAHWAIRSCIMAQKIEIEIEGPTTLIESMAKLADEAETLAQKGEFINEESLAHIEGFAAQLASSLLFLKQFQLPYNIVN